MTKKLFAVILLAICVGGFFSCSKTSKSTADATMNYFPLRLGHYVTYDVDSIYYGIRIDTALDGVVDTVGVQYEVKSQMKYSITDTTRDSHDSLIYMMDVFYRHYDGDFWQKEGAVIYVRAAGDSITVNQDGTKFVKMKFPVVSGYSWNGNELVNTTMTGMGYLANWTYQYKNQGLSFNNNLFNCDNTVTVLEDDESVNYPMVDSAVNAYRTYAKEVYGYNIGMVYREWTHWTYYPNETRFVSGYTVTMRAVDFNN